MLNQFAFQIKFRILVDYTKNSKFDLQTEF